MTKRNNGKSATKCKIIFTDHLKDQIFINGEKLARQHCKLDKLPYPIERLGERINSTIETLSNKVALAEWCLKHNQTPMTYKHGIKELGL